MPEISRNRQNARYAEDVVNVKDFGAKGDGVTDDTSAIQAAIDSGASIVEGRGTFLVAGAGISIQRDDLFLKLEKVKRTTAGSCIVVGTYTGVNATNVQVINFRFEGAFEGPGYRSATEVVGVDVQSSRYTQYWFDRSTNLKTVYQRKAREGLGSDHPTTERTHIHRIETKDVDYPIVCLPNTVDLGAPTYTTYAGSRELWINHANLATAITNIKCEDLDGLHINEFTLFQDPSDESERLDNIELHDCEHVNITNGNCFEAGRNGIRMSDTKNVNISNVNVVWAGEQAEEHGIYIFSRDTNAKNDNIHIDAVIEGASGHGLFIDGSVTTIPHCNVNLTIDDSGTSDHLDPNIITRTHDGADNASVLTNSTASWRTNELVGLVIQNTTDGSEGTITANTATTVTATLSGGTDNDWDIGDAYKILYSGMLARSVSLATGSISNRSRNETGYALTLESSVLYGNFKVDSIEDVKGVALVESDHVVLSKDVQLPETIIPDSVKNVPTSTGTALDGIGSAINTSGKYEGKMVFNIGTNRPVWATGSAAGDVWRYADGTTAHTPV